ncbi:hypothetical protein ACFZA9_16310 [Streptomyces olivaceus]|uniref:hypothetical protein n=1 Tax=Streptomyces olivaceus TaxID=47716 RepID=UPI0036EB9C86
MTGSGFAGRAVAAYVVGFVMFLCLRHWQVGLAWSQAAQDAAVFALVFTLVGLALRRVLRVGERRQGDGRD